MAFTTPIADLIERNSNGLLGKHADWGRVRLGEVAVVQNGAAFKADYFNTDGRGMPLIRIRDVVRGETETWYDGPFEDKYIVRAGDLLIGMDGDFNHATWEGPPGLLNQRVCRLHFKADDLSQEFVAYVLGGYLEAVNDATPSITVKHLSSRTIADLLLPFPPRDAQDRLVAELTRLSEQIDQGLALFRQAQEGCQQLRGALLHEPFAADSGRVAIGDIAEVFVGATPSRKDPSLWNGPVPWVSSGEVAFCRITHTRETISERGLGNPSTRLHSPGTVLLAMIGEGKTRGQAAILDVPAAHNQNSASIRLDRKRMIPEFLYYCLAGMYDENRRSAEGSQQPALNSSLVRAIQVPCPPLEQQRQVVDMLAKQLPNIERLESGFAEQVQRAASLRRALLRATVSGTLLPTSGIDAGAPRDGSPTRASDGTSSTRDILKASA